MEPTKTTREPEKQTSANFLVNFFNHVENLDHWCALYDNVLRYVENKYGKDHVDKCDDSDKMSINNAIENVSYYVNRTKTTYDALVMHLKMKPDPKLKALFTELRTSFVMKRETLDEYKKILYSLLVTEVMKNLLESSQSVIDSMYSE